MDAEFQFRKVDGGDRHSVSRMDLTLLKSAFKVVKRSILCFGFFYHTEKLNHINKYHQSDPIGPVGRPSDGFPWPLPHPAQEGVSSELAGKETRSCLRACRKQNGSGGVAELSPTSENLSRRTPPCAPSLRVRPAAVAEGSLSCFPVPRLCPPCPRPRFPAHSRRSISVCEAARRGCLCPLERLITVCPPGWAPRPRRPRAGIVFDWWTLGCLGL